VRRPQLLMKRRDLEGIDKPQLPKGYSVRTYQEGDGSHWARIISGAFGTECTPAVFRREIAEQGEFCPEAVFFVVYKGEPVGTATAWSRPELGPLSGYVHMLAVERGHTGKGLGKALTAVVLTFFRNRGLRSAHLHTDDHRLPAIRLYLELGFEPVIEGELTRCRWVDVFRRLKRPDLSHRYCGEE
jgi:mycothiol synthase